jgi:hypothetical protein
VPLQNRIRFAYPPVFETVLSRPHVLTRRAGTAPGGTADPDKSDTIPVVNIENPPMPVKTTLFRKGFRANSLTWKLNQKLIPDAPRERAAGWRKLIEMVNKDLSSGITKDWGSFPGKTEGYCIVEGSQLDVMKRAQQYVPYVRFTSHPVASVAELGEMLAFMVT